MPLTLHCLVTMKMPFQVVENSCLESCICTFEFEIHSPQYAHHAYASRIPLSLCHYSVHRLYFTKHSVPVQDVIPFPLFQCTVLVLSYEAPRKASKWRVTTNVATVH